MMRYFIGFVVTIGLIILLIVLLFSGGGTPKVPKTSKTLVSYANTSAEAQMTIDGPINSPLLHNQIRITVGKSQIKYEQIKGYNDQVVKQQVYPNTQESYDNFLHALSHLDFTKASPDASTYADERGYCPTSKRYIFELNQDGRTIEHLWASTCKKPRTYLGDLSKTIVIFKSQVADYKKLSIGLGL